MFLGGARTEAPERYFTWVGAGLTHEALNFLEKLERVKHSSLFSIFVNYVCKKFYKYGPAKRVNNGCKMIYKICPARSLFVYQLTEPD
jgi:hypothetical protein